jgi:hypothetical protein
MTGLSLIVSVEPSAIMPRALSRSYPAFAARRQGECALPPKRAAAFVSPRRVI